MVSCNFLEKSREFDTKKLTVFLNPGSLSKFYGQKKCNRTKLTGMGYDLQVGFDDTLGKYEMRIEVSA